MNRRIFSAHKGTFYPSLWKINLIQNHKYLEFVLKYSTWVNALGYIPPLSGFIMSFSSIFFINKPGPLKSSVSPEVF